MSSVEEEASHMIVVEGILRLGESFFLEVEMSTMGSLPLIIIRYLIQVIPEWSSGFPYFLQFKSEFV